MRLRLGRPDLARYGDRFDVPAASEAAHGPSITFLGVSTLLLDDGRSAVMTDGFFTRPPLWRVGIGWIGPDERVVARTLARAGVSRLEAVVPVHSHYDHALDSAVVARRTGADLVGGESTANIGRGGGLPEDRIRVVRDGDTVGCGSFSLSFVASRHCPPDRFPGTIDEPVVPPVRAGAYRCGEAWSIVVEHSGGRSALVQGSAGYVAGSLDGHRADVAYLGVGQLGVRDEGYIEDYWEHTVRAVGARRVVLTHFDDFFRSLDESLRALPYAGDDLDVTMGVLDRLAAADGVALHLPTVWRREDPWLA